MKSLTSALCILILISFSCKKEGKNEEKFTTTITNGESNNGNPILDSFVIKTANRVDPDQPTPPNYVTLTTVIMYSSYNFSFNWSVGLALGHGNGSYTMSNPTTGVTGGNSQNNWQQGLFYWTNFPGSTLIYFTIKVRNSYYAAIKSNMDHVEDDIIIDGIYNIKTGVYTMSVHIVGSHIIP